MKRFNKHFLLFSAAIFSRLASLSAVLIVQMLVLVPSCYAGAFIFASEDEGVIKGNGVDVIAHPASYDGVGGVLTVGVCIDPASVNTQDDTFKITDMEISVQNIVDTFNKRTITTGNLFLDGNNNIPAADFDFESVALHEVGHCLGLAHVNASSESFSAPPNNAAEAALRNYTKATNGADDIFNFAAGADGIIGSSDDVRGDDVNLHWFNNTFNDPFQIDNPVDSTTYSRVLSNLPAGDVYATNADRNVATLFGFQNTESIMQQGTVSDEAQRTLVADEIATLRYAMSGLDEIAGNADDYTLNLEYRGITTANCDITITLKPDPGFAFCSPAGFFVGPPADQHISIATATIVVSDVFNWFFNDISAVVDGVPDAFSFADVLDLETTNIVVSSTIVVTGMTNSAAVSVVGGEYRINSGSFTSVAGTVNNGDSVILRHTSSVDFSTSIRTTLTIGGESATFTSTTKGSSSGGGGSLHAVVVLILLGLIWVKSYRRKNWI